MDPTQFSSVVPPQVQYRQYLYALYKKTQEVYYEMMHGCRNQDESKFKRFEYTSLMSTFLAQTTIQYKNSRGLLYCRFCCQKVDFVCYIHPDDVCSGGSFLYGVVDHFNKCQPFYLMPPKLKGPPPRDHPYETEFSPGPLESKGPTLVQGLQALVAAVDQNTLTHMEYRKSNPVPDANGPGPPEYEEESLGPDEEIKGLDEE